MTKVAYLECPTGIAGDMCLGALIHAGVPLNYLIEKLHQLGISDEYQLRAEQVQRNQQVATKVHVDLAKDLTNLPHVDHAHTDADHHPHAHEHEHSHHHKHDHTHKQEQRNEPDAVIAHRHEHSRYLPEIEKLITDAKLPPQVEAWSLAIFRKLAIAEGSVHGIAPEKVHFHEVGATDAIVDIVGTCLGLDWLGIEEIYCSPLPTGGGTVNAAHGKLAVPVPAVLKLWELRQVPVYSNGIQRELVTPTGAAIVCTLCKDFCAAPPMNIQQIGLGAGSRDLEIPNILRLWIGEKSNLSPNPPIPAPPSPQLETISVLETQIDDLNPQAIGYVFQSLFNAGAVDVFTQSIGMKKSRPGILLTVICHPENLATCERIIFRETSTLGVRRFTQERAILQREIQQVQTDYGIVRVKVAWSENDGEKTIMNVQPEYEDCAELARKNNLPWREIYQIALQNWRLLPSLD